MNNYKIIYSEYMEKLESRVNEHLSDGFIACGGVAVSTDRWTNERKGYEESLVVYHQAVVKEN